MMSMIIHILCGLLAGFGLVVSLIGGWYLADFARFALSHTTLRFNTRKIIGFGMAYEWGTGGGSEHTVGLLLPFFEIYMDFGKKPLNNGI